MAKLIMVEKEIKKKDGTVKYEIKSYHEVEKDTLSEEEILELLFKFVYIDDKAAYEVKEVNGEYKAVPKTSGKPVFVISFVG